MLPRLEGAGVGRRNHGRAARDERVGLTGQGVALRIEVSLLRLLSRGQRAVLSRCQLGLSRRDVGRAKVGKRVGVGLVLGLLRVGLSQPKARRRAVGEVGGGSEAR